MLFIVRTETVENALLGREIPLIGRDLIFDFGSYCIVFVSKFKKLCLIKMFLFLHSKSIKVLPLLGLSKSLLGFRVTWTFPNLSSIS